MAKKLVEIESNVHKRSNDFYKYLLCKFSNDVLDIINIIKTETNIYLFSGVIRNYFINKRFEGLRDIDFLIEDDLDLTIMFPKYEISKNNFGGYKIHTTNNTIDIWAIKNTWALNYGQLKIKYSQLDYLPNTTFFNFSSILYSLNNKEFIVGKPFLRFLRDKELDIVMEQNPFPSLCIVNSFYYSDKYSLKMSGKLKKYILKNFEQNNLDYTNIQLKHFGRVMYSSDDIKKRINDLLGD